MEKTKQVLEAWGEKGGYEVVNLEGRRVSQPGKGSEPGSVRAWRGPRRPARRKRSKRKLQPYAPQQTVSRWARTAPVLAHSWHLAPNTPVWIPASFLCKLYLREERFNLPGWGSKDYLLHSDLAQAVWPEVGSFTSLNLHTLICTLTRLN